MSQVDRPWVGREAEALDAPVRHPWWSSVAVALVWRLAIFAAAFGLPPLALVVFPDLGALLVNLVAALVPLAVIARLGWWHLPWLATVRPQRWWPLAPLVVLYSARLVFGWDLDLWSSVTTAVFVLVAAASEELYSRGVIQELLRAVRPLWRATAVGVLFGSGHLLSGVVFGREPEQSACVRRPAGLGSGLVGSSAASGHARPRPVPRSSHRTRCCGRTAPLTGDA